MEDEKIVDLYWQRSPAAIEETDKKYGGYCETIAYNILHSREDAEECLDDTYMAAWNAMPVNRPQRLSPFLAAISRNIALKRARDRSRAKRGGGELRLCIEELSEVIPSGADVEREVEAKELSRLVNGFVSELSQAERRVFLSRYYYMLPVREIARRLGFSESKVKSILYRTRKKLLCFLEKEDIC